MCDLLQGEVGGRGALRPSPPLGPLAAWAARMIRRGRQVPPGALEKPSHQDTGHLMEDTRYKKREAIESD